MRISLRSLFFFFNDTATTEIYTLSLHDALPISYQERTNRKPACRQSTIFLWGRPILARSEEHTSELQSRLHLVCRLLLEKKNKNKSNDQFNQNKIVINANTRFNTKITLFPNYSF